MKPYFDRLGTIRDGRLIFPKGLVARLHPEHLVSVPWAEILMRKDRPVPIVGGEAHADIARVAGARALITSPNVTDPSGKYGGRNPH